MAVLAQGANASKGGSHDAVAFAVSCGRWRGVITAIRPYIIQMQSQGRRFHPDLITHLLEVAGE